VWREHVSGVLAYEPPQWKSARAKTADRVHRSRCVKQSAHFVDKHPGATFVSDGGEIGQWAQALVKTDRRIINGVAGTIGVSLPFAIARAVRPSRLPCDCRAGRRYLWVPHGRIRQPPSVTIFQLSPWSGNDARWNAEYQIQLRQYGAEARQKNCDLLLRPAMIAWRRRSEGVGALVSTAAESTRCALIASYLSRRPACINVMIESVAAPVIRQMRNP